MMRPFSEKQLIGAKVTLHSAYDSATVALAAGDPNGFNSTRLEQSLRATAEALGYRLEPASAGAEGDPWAALFAEAERERQAA